MKDFSSFWEKFKVVNKVAVPVNTQGVMGAGLALAIKQELTFEEWSDYIEICTTASPGEVVQSMNPKYLFCFTKQQWEKPSSLLWVERCLQSLILHGNSEQTLLLPKLGAGLGGLPEKAVVELIESYIPKMGWKDVFVA